MVRECSRLFESLCVRKCMYNANQRNEIKFEIKFRSKSNSPIVCVCKHETGRSQFDDSVCVGSTVEAIDDREWSIRTVNKREDAALRQHNNQINN